MIEIIVEINEENEELYKKIEEIVKQNNTDMQIIDPLMNMQNLSFSDLYIDVCSRQVIIRGKEIVLTAKEFDILYFLASHPNFVFTHQQIYEAVWKREYVCDSGNVTAHIGHIRKKIESNPRHPVYIQTIRGVGYKFVKQ